MKNEVLFNLKTFDYFLQFFAGDKRTFVNNVIDPSSGTIRGRAVFNNPDGVFTPGMFARVRVP